MLVTGCLDRPWKALCPGDRGYDQAFNIFINQGHMDRYAHEGAFRTLLGAWEGSSGPSWPRKRGQPTNYGFYAAAIILWRKRGYSRAQIEAAAGRGKDNLTKHGWPAANAYEAWRKRQPLSPGGLDSMALFEAMYAAGAPTPTKSSGSGSRLGTRSEPRASSRR
jgi:hypothetical protein